MAKFKVGDKVRVKSNLDGCVGVSWTMLNNRGNVMTISLYDATEHMQYKVEEDRLNLWWDESVFEPVAKREFIVIHQNGNVMTAEHRVNRDVIKSAKATCAPSDTFDFNTGAKLAFDRLMGREEPKPAPQPAHRFKVGDRVLHEKYGFGSILHDDKAVFRPYLVLFDKDIGSACQAMSTNGITNKKNCAWSNESDLSHAPAPEPPKFYTGKVVCIHNATVLFRDIFPVGLIVTIKDGKITSILTGKEMRVDHVKKETNEIKSVDDLNNRFYKDILFAEVKEPSNV